MHNVFNEFDTPRCKNGEANCCYTVCNGDGEIAVRCCRLFEECTETDEIYGDKNELKSSLEDTIEFLKKEGLV